MASIARALARLKSTSWSASSPVIVSCLHVQPPLCRTATDTLHAAKISALWHGSKQALSTGSKPPLAASKRPSKLWTICMGRCACLVVRRNLKKIHIHIYIYIYIYRYIYVYIYWKCSNLYIGPRSGDGVQCIMLSFQNQAAGRPTKPKLVWIANW